MVDISPISSVSTTLFSFFLSFFSFLFFLSLSTSLCQRAPSPSCPSQSSFHESTLEIEAWVYAKQEESFTYPNCFIWTAICNNFFWLDYIAIATLKTSRNLRPLFWSYFQYCDSKKQTNIFLSIFGHLLARLVCRRAKKDKKSKFSN